MSTSSLKGHTNNPRYDSSKVQARDQRVCCAFLQSMDKQLFILVWVTPKQPHCKVFLHHAGSFPAATQMEPSSVHFPHYLLRPPKPQLGQNCTQMARRKGWKVRRRFNDNPYALLWGNVSSPLTLSCWALGSMHSWFYKDNGCFTQNSLFYNRICSFEVLNMFIPITSVGRR